MPRIVLIHPYRPSMAPIEAAFSTLWPEAEVCALLDETLYADVAADGTMKSGVTERIDTLVHHAVASGADAVVFTGSTFGPAVDRARAGMTIPVLKADEAMAIHAAQKGGEILLVCTAPRALPVLIANLEAEIARKANAVTISTLVVADAKAALVAGDDNLHDRLIAAAISSRPVPTTLMLGQVSMGRVSSLLSVEMQRTVVTSAEASATYLKAIFS